MRHFSKSILAIAAFSASCLASAGSLVMDFEGLAVGTLISVTNPYAGVTFAPAAPLGSGGQVVDSPISNAPSGVNALLITPSTTMTTSFAANGFSFYYTTTDGYGPDDIIINGTAYSVPSAPLGGTCPTPTPYPGLCAWSLFTYTGPVGVPLVVDFSALAYHYYLDNVTVVPEPASIALVGLGLLGAGFASRRSRRA